MQWKNSVGFAVLAAAVPQFFVAAGAAALAIGGGVTGGTALGLAGLARIRERER